MAGIQGGERSKPGRPAVWARILDWKYIEYLLVRGFAGVLFWLPAPLMAAGARATGFLLYYWMGKRRDIAMLNLNIAYGSGRTARKKKEIVIAAFQNIILSIAELLTVRRVLKSAKEKFSLQGTEHFDKAFERGKGVVMVTSHMGSWEYLGFLPFFGYPTCVVVKPLRNPYLYAWIHDLREATGLINIDKKNSIKRVLQELKKNHIVAILIDQWAGVEGVDSSFFGLRTSTTSIPARLARRTGAALIPAYCLRKPGCRYEIQVEPPIVLSEDSEDWEKITTEALNRQLEKRIKQTPEQWTWTHRRWKKMKDE